MLTTGSGYSGELITEDCAVEPSGCARRRLIRLSKKTNPTMRATPSNKTATASATKLLAPATGTGSGATSSKIKRLISGIAGPGVPADSLKRRAAGPGIAITGTAVGVDSARTTLVLTATSLRRSGRAN